jgi:3-hydroxyisobutyrate dehydrogenase
MSILPHSAATLPTASVTLVLLATSSWHPAATRLSLMQKDMALALAQARRLNVPVPTADASGAAFTEAVAMGLGDLDCAAMLSYMEAVLSAATGSR